jgi:hypothetical protein
METIFDGFDLNGILYYSFNGEYYKDDMISRVVISIEEYRDAFMCKMIREV